jgi:hypothetical protein
MTNSAASTGDMENLMIWATQGVRVTSGIALIIAIAKGSLALVQLLVRELGADINQTGLDTSPLHMALSNDDLAMVRCLVQLGATIAALNDDGDTALLVSARIASFPTMQYLLEEAGANINDANNRGRTVWDMLLRHFAQINRRVQDETDTAALTALLRVMVPRGAPPPALVALLSPEPAHVLQEGARLRARLPAYLAHRRAYLDSRCPRISVLPDVLGALIYTFEGPATTEELWAMGLGQAP